MTFSSRFYFIFVCELRRNDAYVRLCSTATMLKEQQASQQQHQWHHLIDVQHLHFGYLMYTVSHTRSHTCVTHAGKYTLDISNNISNACNRIDELEACLNIS